MHYYFQFDLVQTSIIITPIIFFCTVLVVGKSLKKVTVFLKSGLLAVQTEEADSGVFTLFCQHGKSQEGILTSH